MVNAAKPVLSEIGAGAPNAVVTRVHAGAELEGPISSVASRPVAGVIPAMLRAGGFGQDDATDDRSTNPDPGISAKVASGAIATGVAMAAAPSNAGRSPPTASTVLDRLDLIGCYSRRGSHRRQERAAWRCNGWSEGEGRQRSTDRGKTRRSKEVSHVLNLSCCLSGSHERTAHDGP
jgi:hypothetical protein